MRGDGPILLRRAYEAAEPDGRRFPVERLWPSGVRKADLRPDAWLNEVRNAARILREHLAGGARGKKHG